VTKIGGTRHVLPDGKALKLISARALPWSQLGEFTALHHLVERGLLPQEPPCPLLTLQAS